MMFKHLVLENVFQVLCESLSKHGTLPETNVAPKNEWLEYYFPIGEAFTGANC